MARDVGHIHHEVGADFVGHLTEELEIDDAGIGGSAGNDHLGSVLQGLGPDVVIVDEAGLDIDAVADGVVKLALLCSFKVVDCEVEVVQSDFVEAFERGLDALRDALLVFLVVDRGIGGVRPVAPPTWLVSNFLVRPASS